MPVFNEGSVFEDWFPGLLGVAERIGAQVVVIDDGSGEKVQVLRAKGQEGIGLRGERGLGGWRGLGREDEDEGMTHSTSLRARFKVLRHPVNCGVGAALQTGLEYVRHFDPDFVLTIDGDGQHDPEDLLSLYKEIKAGGIDIVNGSRFLKKQSIPFVRRVANFLGNIVNFSLSGYWLSDSQSGMKGFSKKALAELRNFSPGYEWCLDVFRIANWNAFKLKEVSVSVLYNSYTLNKGQAFSIGIDMVFRLIIRSLMRSAV